MQHVLSQTYLGGTEFDLLVHTVEHELVVAALEPQHPLAAIQVTCLVLEKRRHEGVEFLLLEHALELQKDIDASIRITQD